MWERVYITAALLHCCTVVQVLHNTVQQDRGEGGGVGEGVHHCCTVALLHCCTSIAQVALCSRTGGGGNGVGEGVQCYTVKGWCVPNVFLCLGCLPMYFFV